MVSSAPAPLINPTVSYAESVKKVHSPRSPNAVRNSFGDFPAISGASGISSSSSSPPSNATSHLSSVEAIGGSQAGASDFPELSTEISSQNAVKDHNGPTNHVHPNANNVPKAAPAVNVWTERLKEQMALAPIHAHQPQRQPRTIVTSSAGAPSVPHRLRPIVMGTSPHTLDATNAVPSASTSRSSPLQTISLNGDDSCHDPFIVRMPSHLSRHSSSKSIRLVNDTDTSNWLEAMKTPSIELGEHDGGEKPRRKNSIDSTRHQSDSRPSSAQMSRLNSRNVFEANSTGSHSVPYSLVESQAGSSSSSPRLQVRGRRLPDDDLTVVYDLRHEPPKVPYNPPRMSSRVPERTPYHHHHHHHTFSHPPDISSQYFRSPPIPIAIDAPLHPARLSPLLSAIRHPYYANPVSGHTSPTYAGSRPPSGAGTPPYPVYPPYTVTCGYCHSRIPWDGFVPPIHPRPVPGFSSPLLQDEYTVPPPTLPTFFNPPFPGTTEPSPNTHLTQSERSYESSQDAQLHPAIVSRNMVFGSIGLTHNSIHQMPKEMDAAGKESKEPIERMAEQFSGFSIGIMPGEPVPSRQGNRKHSTKSLSRPPAGTESEYADTANAMDDATQEERKVVDEYPNTPAGEDVAAPGKKWVFGTTAKFGSLNEDSRNASSERLPLPAELAQPVAPPSGQHSPAAASVAQPSRNEKPVTPPISTTQAETSIMQSEDGSATSDVWEVKDYGYGFGDVSGTDNATDVIRRAKEAREMRRQLEWQKEQAQIQLQKEQELQLDAQEVHIQHMWQEVHEGREVSDQAKEFGRGRPRRGSWASSYGSHERGAYGGRRARGFGGRYQGRHPGRGGYHHQQRSSISSLTPPPQFNPLPLPGADYMNGYIQIPSYTPPDYELYHPVPVTIPVNGAPPIPMPQSTLAFPQDPTRSYLLGQLEYYLSPQNMAQDFFLRQRMDDQGWIPISLIASFNRVQKFTTEIQLVHDVLNLSSLTEVKGEYVRMAREQWKQFVLPNAPRSVVCHPIESEATDPQADQAAYAQVQDGEIEEEGDTYGEDDDEEDIVFVIGEEAEGSWAPERRSAASENT
ncbi:hypothetical protein DEU56DRAFT_775768 [Suillus clintonianus]|uniref:uncharacterized protein n=1 Tax=Suillus clintonianus TaxID=1904413 RepID=UPI001B86BC8C|nr:uncharacterized protein DEU56DRAFT_775768 [Suillus clintonianus]KAG2152745.1 hypothetical protein DEU56DRAFT_775768 [Suillus clintonianus]